MSSRKNQQSQHDVATKTRKIRAQTKRNRKPRGSRRKDWIPNSFDDPDAFDDFDCPQNERIMPRGEQERRQTVEAAAWAALDSADDDTGTLPLEEMSDQHGIVVEVSSGLCSVVLNGQRMICGIRGSLSAEKTGFTNVIAVGDRVIVSEDGAGQGVVEAVLPRQSILARPDVFHNGGRTRDRHQQQIIVANADQVLIVASWRAPHLWPELVDRYLIAAERSNLTPIICINKVDLAEDVTDCRVELQPYTDLGYRVVFTSALTGEGIKKLRKNLRGRATVLAGMSGVGKSSLLNAIQPGLQIHTQEVSEHSHEGRHTTARVSMRELEMGGFVVDTPGIREFGLSGLRREELAHFYPEIADVANRCRFGDCSHTHEPGCAVKSAVQMGHVSTSRYYNYKHIYDGLPS